MRAQQAAAAQKNRSPFSVKVGDVEIGPALVWGGVALLGFSVLRGMLSAVGIGGKSKEAKGKWVYDRSLGGKKVWVPADGEAPVDLPAQSVRPLITDGELDRLASVAAAAAPGTAAAGTAPVFQVPTWWNPSPRFYPDLSTRTARQADADRLLTRIETGKNRGLDYSIADIVKLRQLCQEGSISVTPRTVGSRDAIFRAAVDACVSYASDPIESGVDLDGLEPTRFLSSLAGDLGLTEDKAVAVVSSVVAGATRARLVEALAGIKASSSGGAGGETDAVMAVIRLTSLLQRLPVLAMMGNEVPLIADSLQRTFEVDDRRKVFYLFGQLFPEAAALGAALLGFKPEMVVPQLLQDMDAYRREAQQLGQ